MAANVNALNLEPTHGLRLGPTPVPTPGTNSRASRANSRPRAKSRARRAPAPAATPAANSLSSPPGLKPTTRWQALACVRANGLSLEGCAGFNNDYEVVLAAVQQNAMALQFASSQKRATRELVLAAVTLNGHALQYASNDLRGEADIVCTAVQVFGECLEHVSGTLKNNQNDGRYRDLFLKALETNAYVMPYVHGTRFKNNIRYANIVLDQLGWAETDALLCPKQQRNIIQNNQQGRLLIPRPLPCEPTINVFIIAKQLTGRGTVEVHTLTFYQRESRSRGDYIFEGQNSIGALFEWASYWFRVPAHKVALKVPQVHGDGYDTLRAPMRTYGKLV